MPQRLVSISQDCQSRWPVILVVDDEKGFRQRRENTSSRFQAFCNALGHENWNLCCLNDEMAHQRDLKVELHTTGHQEVISIREKRRNEKHAQLLHFRLFCFFTPIQ